MQLVDLLPAINRIHAIPHLDNLRGTAYLLTYPHISAHIAPGTTITLTRFLQLAAMTYGWMPRVLQMDNSHLTNAVAALNMGSVVTTSNFRTVPVDDIKRCLHSVVGASKMLHFVNDKVFPIWDSKIELFRKKSARSETHMQNTANYFDYVADVHAICAEPGFPKFYADFLHVYAARQRAMGITTYPVSEVRAVEAAAFELA